MTNKTKLPDELSAEVNQFIKDKIEIEREYWNKCSADSDRAKTYVAGYGKGVSAGATAYATRLHEAQQENEQLRIDVALYKQDFITFTKENKVLADENERLRERCKKMAKEQADLNLALAAMLNGYQNLSMYQKDWFTVPKDLIDAYTKMVLEYDTQGKEGESNTPDPGEGEKEVGDE